MSDDTDAAARAVQLAIVRRRTPSERMDLVVEMSEMVRDIAVEGERRRLPELTAQEARRIVFERMWGRELAARVEAFRRAR